MTPPQTPRYFGAEPSHLHQRDAHPEPGPYEVQVAALAVMESIGHANRSLPAPDFLPPGTTYADLERWASYLRARCEHTGALSEPLETKRARWCTVCGRLVPP